MELTRYTWLVLIIAAFIVGLIVRGCLPPPGVQTLLQPTPVIEVTIGGTCTVPSGGAACHFVSKPEDKDNPVDLTLQVPPQKVVGSLIFTSEPRKANDRPKSTIDKPIYRNFMGLKATDAKGNPVDHFDPAITIIAKYYQIDLDFTKRDYGKEDPDNLTLFLHDGQTWRRLPMLVGSRDSKAMTLTSLIGSFTSSDDVADGGD